jgi:hypothetical protein
MPAPPKTPPSILLFRLTWALSTPHALRGACCASQFAEWCHFATGGEPAVNERQPFTRFNDAEGVLPSRGVPKFRKRHRFRPVAYT